jgi:hypothetical protein
MVILELGEEHIVQIVTDNGSNYKKACKLVSQKYRIVWQPCLAHTINLMLKSIGEFPDHKAMIEAARMSTTTSASTCDKPVRIREKNIYSTS